MKLSHELQAIYIIHLCICQWVRCAIMLYKAQAARLNKCVIWQQIMYPVCKIELFFVFSPNVIETNESDLLILVFPKISVLSIPMFLPAINFTCTIPICSNCYLEC